MKHKFTSTSLAQSFDRRSFVVGAIQGGVGLLLAARMVAMLDRFRLMRVRRID